MSLNKEGLKPQVEKGERLVRRLNRQITATKPSYLSMGPITHMRGLLQAVL